MLEKLQNYKGCWGPLLPGTKTIPTGRNAGKRSVTEKFRETVEYLPILGGTWCDNEHLQWYTKMPETLCYRARRWEVRQVSNSQRILNDCDVHVYLNLQTEAHVAISAVQKPVRHVFPLKLLIR